MRGGAAWASAVVKTRAVIDSCSHGTRSDTRVTKEGGERGFPDEWSQDLLAHGRFLAHLFTRARRRWPAWRRAEGKPFPTVWRPSVNCRCGYGVNLARPEEFAEQAKAAQSMLDWDRAQSFLLKRLESGRTPLVLDLFCCAGGVSEGMRRAGWTSFGVDQDDQPEFKARFGTSWFQRGDALDRQSLRALVRKAQAGGGVGVAAVRGELDRHLWWWSQLQGPPTDRSDSRHAPGAGAALCD